MTRLAFTVPGKPQSKQRARRGRGRRWYTPAATRNYQERARGYAQAALMQEPELRRTWPVADGTARYRVELEVYLPDKRRRDVDNVAKSILDAQNHVLWEDDSQVVELTVRKGIDREAPRVEVVVEVMG